MGLTKAMDLTKKGKLKIHVGRHGLLLMLLASFALLPIFVRDKYFLGVCIAVFTNCILAVVLLPVFNSGLLFMASGGFKAIGAYISALLVMKLEISFWVAFPISALATGIIAVLIGIPSLRIRGLYFMIITFGVNEVTALLIKNWRSLTGGSDGLSKIPVPNSFSLPWIKIDFSSYIHFYIFALLMAVLTTVFIHLLWSSRIGRISQAIRSAEDLVESVGISAYRHKMMIFFICGCFTGLVGSFYAHYYTFLSPADFGIWASIYPVVFFQVGGVGSISGPVLGAMFLTIIPEFFRGFDVYQPIAFGIVIIVIMRFFPKGIIGVFQRIGVVRE